jgi:uncharacterized protein YegP (UPF0339 family)
MKRAKVKIKPTAKGLRYYYVVVAANGETLVTSETYTRKLDAKRAVKALKRAVLLAKVEDHT